jgi:hypothetical protein
MIIKLNCLTTEQYRALNAILTGPDNLVDPPLGCSGWIDPDNIPASVRQLKVISLLAAKETKTGFEVTVKVKQEAMAVPRILKTEGDYPVVKVSIGPVLTLLRGMGLYPEYTQGFPDGGETMRGTVELVSLRRAGSGDMTVRAPSQEWFDLIKGLSEYNYGEVTFAVDTQDIMGYSGFPGCTLWLFPGDKDGRNISENLDYVREPPRPRPEELVYHHDHGGALGISTNYDDLKAFHEILGRALANLAARRVEK